MKSFTNLGRIGIIVFTCLISSLSFGQESSKKLKQYFADLAGNPGIPLPTSILSDGKNQNKLLNVIEEHLEDTSFLVKTKAYQLAARIGQHTTSIKTQKKCVEILFSACRSKDSGLSRMVVHALRRFPVHSFSKPFIDSLGALISPSFQQLPSLLRLVGYLQLNQYNTKINALLTQKVSGDVKWAARLALARMGDESASSWIHSKLDLSKVNSDFMYEVVPDLIYTRDRSIFTFLLEVLNSEAVNCSSPNPDMDLKMHCGYHLLEKIAPVIANFPIQIDEEGDLLVNNYEQALEESRKWFLENPLYQIVSTTY